MVINLIHYVEIKSFSLLEDNLTYLLFKILADAFIISPM